MRFRGKAVRADRALIMAIINRTPDSFYDRGATFGLREARDAAVRAVSEGADIIDVGGVKAGPGRDVDAVTEAGRVVPLIEWMRATMPEVVLSVDTWRSDVGRLACEAGADLINDSWAGADPRLAEVAASFGAGYVCSHTGGLPPRSRPHRVAYSDVMTEVTGEVCARARRAVDLGVPADGVLVDPTHDFGKNTWHSLELTRRLSELVSTGWPVLVSVSNKDFVGEALGVEASERLLGTLATTAVSAWQGAAAFRAHNVSETRHVLDMVSAIHGTRSPAAALRGLA